jgi:hypothetical protein
MSQNNPKEKHFLLYRALEKVPYGKNIVRLLPSTDFLLSYAYREDLNLISKFAVSLLAITATFIVVKFAAFFFVNEWHGAAAIKLMDMLIGDILTMLSVGVAVFIFVWSWAAFIISKELSDHHKQRHPAVHLATNHIGDHVRHFVTEAGYVIPAELSDTIDTAPVRVDPYADALAKVTAINMTLSTLVYGIEDQRHGPRYMLLLVRCLRRWAEIANKKESNVHLQISVWNKEEHIDIWSIRNAKSSSKRWHTQGSIEDIAVYLEAMIEFCQLFGYIKMSPRIHLTTNLLPKNDIRMFLIERDHKLFSGLFVVFSRFEQEIANKNAISTTAFSTHTIDGLTRFEAIKQQYDDIYKNYECEDGSWKEDKLVDNPFCYFMRHFELDKDWCGIVDVEDSNCVDKFCHENPDWYLLDKSKWPFNVSNMAAKLYKTIREQPSSAN